ncbi:hypothetical protein GF342_04980 [Candidatus Woesearchaeota archaeon]|nr:hypothetical protein [Candidatus Woesearchaeota archaeon]
MDHVAILNPPRVLDKILRGEKTIESRWYKARYAPWGRIRQGERVFFKVAGKPVTAVATVRKVLEFEIAPDPLLAVLDKYGKDIAFDWSLDKVYVWALEKKYGILVFLEQAYKLNPFDVSKKGFGNACAWMCVESIDDIRKT